MPLNDTQLMLLSAASRPGTSTSTIAERGGCSGRFVRQTLNLAFLSPTPVKATVDGTQPRGRGVSKLADSPLDWQEQVKQMLAWSRAEHSPTFNGAPHRPTLLRHDRIGRLHAGQQDTAASGSR
jgi:hypothetical protein